MDAAFQKISLQGEKHFDDKVFPLTLAPKSDELTFESVLKAVKNSKKDILDQLVAHGAILFRGLPVKTAEEFNQFVLEFGWKDMPYIGGIAFRTNIVGAVHTSNESPPDQPIFFHHEMIYMPKYPSHLFFYCETPPKQGGETPICLSSAAYEEINRKLPEFVSELKEKGVRYTRVMPYEDDDTSGVGRSWQHSFKTSNPREVEEKCKGIYERIEWLEDQSLKTISMRMPGVRLDERTGKTTWFNQIVAAYYAWFDSRNVKSEVVTFGDGTKFDTEVVAQCYESLNECKVEFKWERNDILLIDNLQVLHARNAYVPPRRILAALFE